MHAMCGVQFSLRSKNAISQKELSKVNLHRFWKDCYLAEQIPSLFRKCAKSPLNVAEIGGSRLFVLTRQPGPMESELCGQEIDEEMTKVPAVGTKTVESSAQHWTGRFVMNNISLCRICWLCAWIRHADRWNSLNWCLIPLKLELMEETGLVGMKCKTIPDMNGSKLSYLSERVFWCKCSRNCRRSLSFAAWEQYPSSPLLFEGSCEVMGVLMMICGQQTMRTVIATRAGIRGIRYGEDKWWIVALLYLGLFLNCVSEAAALTICHSHAYLGLLCQSCWCD